MNQERKESQEEKSNISNFHQVINEEVEAISSEDSSDCNDEESFVQDD